MIELHLSEHVRGVDGVLSKLETTVLTTVWPGGAERYDITVGYCLACLGSV